MKLVRFLAQDKSAYGILNGDEVAELDGDFFTPFKTLKACHVLSNVKLLAPCEPSKVVAVGLNYRDHAQEMGLPIPGEPLIFLKPPTAVIGHEAAIVCPEESTEVHYEAELAIVIKDRIRGVSPEDARGHILGYTCANDVTARDLQRKDGQWTRAKSFDTFCPLGPWIETELNPDDLLVESHVNGKPRQSSRTLQFIFTVDRLVSFISRVMTLLPGDVILTGTPAGIGPIKPGDVVEVSVEGIGRLRNKVK